MSAQFRKPPTMEEATERGMLAPSEHGIHTFSNGSHWDGWASSNCLACRFYDPDALGAKCAFEGAAMLDMVSPELATLFGWTQATAEYGPRSGWHEPERCAFFSDKEDDDWREPPFVDPTQLVMGGIDPVFPVEPEPAPEREHAECVS